MPFFLSISLIIKHTAEVHEQVADLLRQLRRLQDLQVSVEVRFITVQDTFFEYIGVDFDFQIQSDTVGKHTTFAVPNPTTSLFPIPGLTTGTITGTSTSTSTGGGQPAAHRPAAARPAAVAVRPAAARGGGTTGGGGSAAAAAQAAAAARHAGGTTGGSTGGVTEQPVYLVNPIRDHALGNNTPIIVGTQGGGLANFSPNLDLPYTGPTASLAQPSSFQSGAGGTFGIAFLSDLEVYLFLTAAQGDQRANVLQAPKVTTFNGADGDDLQQHRPVLRRVADADRRPRCGGVLADDRLDSERCDPERHSGCLGRPPVCANDAHAVLQRPQQPPDLYLPRRCGRR